MPRRPGPWWVDLEREELLDVRISDLDLTIEDSALARRVERLYSELERAGLRFRPHVWLSTSWFTPDGVPGFAIPFFLAHPRLARIEHAHMFEVEGGSHDWCMKLLRHETGHAIDNAFRLHWRKGWREAFGAFSQPYRDTYQPNPTSRRYVFNLDHWYSQSHPAEDWAECFAVWLRPGGRWRTRYAGWPALKKLEYVDRLMQEVAGEAQKVRSRRRPEALSQARITLREYYRQKKEYYGTEPAEYDRYLLRLFSSDRSQRPTAASFLRRNRDQLRTEVSAMTGQVRYVVDQALRQMIAGCVRHQLRLTRSEAETRVRAAILLTMGTMRYIQGRRQEFVR